MGSQRGGTEFARGERDGVLQKYVARPADRSCVCTVLSRFVCRREPPRHVALRSREVKERREKEGTRMLVRRSSSGSFGRAQATRLAPNGSQ